MSSQYRFSHTLAAYFCFIEVKIMIKERLLAGEVLVLDGAIGTELENKGIPEVHDASWAECLETHPETVLEVHRDYVRAGADIITTNTYSSGPGALTRIGQDKNIKSWNRRAVELAKKACAEVADERDIYVAGSISGFGNGVMQYQGLNDTIDWGEPDKGQVKENFQMQADILVEAGVDLLLLELLGARTEDIQIAIDIATAFTVPVILALSAVACTEGSSLCLQIVDGSNGLANKERFGEAIALMNKQNLLAVLSHHLEIEHVPQALADIRQNWSGPMGVYPNRTGHWTGKKWVFSEEVAPQHYASLAKQWTDSGAQIIGGCCGVTPAHIAAAKENVIQSTTAG